MIQARIKEGRVEVDEPIPPAWEGQCVKLVPLTPDDPLPDLEQRLQALHEMGPIEYENAERESANSLLDEMDSLSKEAMERLSNESR